MAKAGSIKLPVFTEFDGKRIELGEFEIPVHVSVGNAPGGVRATNRDMPLEQGEIVFARADVERITDEISLASKKARASA